MQACACACVRMHVCVCVCVCVCACACACDIEHMIHNYPLSWLSHVARLDEPWPSTRIMFGEVLSIRLRHGIRKPCSRT